MAAIVSSRVIPQTGPFRVNPADLGVSQPQAEINCSMIRTGPGEFTLRTGDAAIHVKCQHDDQFSIMFQWLLDVLISESLINLPHSVMLLRSSGRGTVVLARIEQRHEHECDALLSEHPRETGLAAMSDAFTLSSGLEQENGIRESFVKYRSWIGQDPDWAGDRALNKCRLVVKVDPSELWFLRFPLGMYCRLELGQFRRYEAVQWIVSDRTVSQVVSVSRATEAALDNVRDFLAGAYVIVNTYNAHLKAFPYLREYTGFLLEVMQAFREVQIASSRYSLRWSLNPDESLLRSILLSPETCFVFTNFESDGGNWELGDGEHDCWNRGTTGCPHKRSAPQRIFLIDDLEGRLGHIRLLRAFHCNSIANPYSSAEPAADETLARKLLLTGAWFVEGSATKERYVDHICTLLALLLGRADLRAILRMKTRAGKCDLPGMMNRAGTILHRHGYEPLQQLN